MKEFLVAFAIVFAIAAFIFYPFAIIWSLNNLFSLTIPFTFKTWASTLIIAGVFAANIIVKKD